MSKGALPVRFCDGRECQGFWSNTSPELKVGEGQAGRREELK